MLEGTRQSIGHRISRFRFRKSQEKILSFTRSFSDAREVLVVMPFDRSQLLNTVFVIDLLRKSFREENLTFVSGKGNQELRRMMPRSQFVPLEASDVTTFFLPRTPFLERLSKHSFDLAIDLNLDFLLPSAYICKASNARVRIGRRKKGADLYFNFQIQTEAALGGKEAYDRFAACLQKF